MPSIKILSSRSFQYFFANLFYIDLVSIFSHKWYPEQWSGMSKVLSLDVL